MTCSSERLVRVGSDKRCEEARLDSDVAHNLDDNVSLRLRTLTDILKLVNNHFQLFCRGLEGKKSLALSLTQSNYMSIGMGCCVHSFEDRFSSFPLLLTFVW